MLVFGSNLIGTRVMSLQTGQELAQTSKPVIDPRTLSVIAYTLEGQMLDDPSSLLRIIDIREFSDIGMIVDSSDEFVSPNDIVKLQEILELNFELTGMLVYDTTGHKLGRVIDYSVEVKGFVIQQLSVKRPLIKSFSDSELLIHRSQIKEISDEIITVEAGVAKPEPIKQATRNLVNPFRHAPQADPEPGH